MVLLSQGLSLQTLRRLLDPPPTVEHQDAGLERELWAALPAGCRGAWEGRPPPSSEVQPCSELSLSCRTYGRRAVFAIFTGGFCRAMQEVHYQDVCRVPCGPLLGRSEHRQDFVL